MTMMPSQNAATNDRSKAVTALGRSGALRIWPSSRTELRRMCRVSFTSSGLASTATSAWRLRRQYFESIKNEAGLLCFTSPRHRTSCDAFKRQSRVARPSPSAQTETSTIGVVQQLRPSLLFSADHGGDFGDDDIAVDLSLVVGRASARAVVACGVGTLTLAWHAILMALGAFILCVIIYVMISVFAGGGR